MITPRAARVWRAVAAATVATFVALLSHLAAGAPVPDWLGVYAPWVASILVCTAFSRLKLSLLRQSIGVIASQLLFHYLFVLGTPPDFTVSHTDFRHGMHMMGHLEISTAPVMRMAHGGVGMLLWHGCAAAITIVLLAQGDRAVSVILKLAQRTGKLIWNSWMTPALRPADVASVWMQAVEFIITWCAQGKFSIQNRHRGPPLDTAQR